jgi:hypothetical protein
VFNAALLLMSNADNWEQVHENDLLPEDAAAIAFGIYTDWLVGDCMTCQDVIQCVPELSAGLERDGVINPNSVDPDDSTVVDARFPSELRAENILADPALCDMDAVWSAVLEIATRIDAGGRDFWETAAGETDAIERIGQIVALVPLFGDVIGEGLQLLSDSAPDMLTQYNSYSSQSVIEEIACDIFSMVCNDCRYPTFQELYDYFAGNSALGQERWEELALQAVVDILLGVGQAGPGMVYFTTNIVQLWVLSLAGTWVRSVGVNMLPIWARVGAADPTDAWELLCDGCEPPVSACETVVSNLTGRYGTTWAVDGVNPCLLHVTSGPRQGDSDYYVALDTTQQSGVNFRVDTSNPVGLSLVNCRWTVDGGAAHFTNIAGLEQCSAMDNFYIRSNAAFTIDILFIAI